ncbi:MAG: HD domain-containing phosphohydrolase [Bacilli bacterium]
MIILKLKEKFRSISIRTQVLITFIFLTAITLTILGAVIFSNWFKSAHDVTADLSKKVNEDITLEVSHFLNNPLEFNEANANLISNSYVDMLNQEERERFFVLALNNYDEQVYSFSYGTINGEYYGARRNADNVVEIMRNDATTGGASWYYSVNEDLTANERVLVTGLFDPRTRPWFTEAVENESTVFSPVYQHFIMEDLAISLATPIYNIDGVLQGVIGTHIVLSNINTFLGEFLMANNGSSIIVDLNSNELIANSMGLNNYEILEDNSIHRVTIDELEDDNFNLAYQKYLVNKIENIEFREKLNYEYYSIKEVHENGVDWLVITSVPQGELFSKIIRNIYWMILIFITSVLIINIIYHILIKKLFKPVDELVQVSNEYALGNFEKQIHGSGKDEFSKLAQAFNNMAKQIKEMVNNLENKVQERTEHISLSNKILKESEEKYRLLFETMSQGVVYQDSEGIITSCNRRAEEILGLSLDQMQGKTSMDPRWKMIDEEGRSISGSDHPAMIALKTGKTVGPVTRGVYVPESDSYKWLMITAIPTFLEGKEKPHQVYATLQDVTEQKVAAMEVSYRKELLQYIISRSNQGIAVHDKGLNYVYVSDKYCEMYNVSKDIIGKHHYEVFPDLPQKWRDVHQRSLKGETVSGDRDDFVRADGSIQYTRWLSQPWYDVKGEIAGIIIYTEVIDDLIKTELKLEETLSRLQLVMDNLTIGIAVNSVNPEVEFEYMNENFPIFYGTTRETLMKPNSFWDVVYEDEIFREQIKQKVLQGLSSNDPKLKRWENVPITKNGKIVRYITAQGVNIPNSPLIISMVMDVTEQKHKEEEIIFTSNHDFLTGLPNRRYFEEKLQELDKEEYYPLVVAMFDFDGLKLINDAYGHNVGDEALIKISEVLKESLINNEFVSRIGGDEFVMLCPNATMEKFENKQSFIVNKVKSIKHLDMSYSLSSGFDIKIEVSTDIKEILKNAENNMFANKTLHGQSARSETIMTLFEALKEKYDEEKLHSDRVSQYCKMMGEKLKLNQDQIKELEFAGLMHDIGKITMPDSILDKPGRLTNEEWVIMKKHTINGYQILKSADKYSRLAEYALTHHERMDGKGYPNGLSGDEIPLFSRVICVADAYEAMTADRPYRKALSKEVAINELKRCSGTQFDANLVEIFINEVLVNE